MEQSPFSEANSHSASQEILRLFWNTKAHYRAHNSPSVVPPYPEPDASTQHPPPHTIL